MSVDLARWLAGALAAYGCLGLLFAMASVVVGAPRIDPAARGMTWPARLLLVPGAAALWPLMLFKWVTRRSPPEA